MHTHTHIQVEDSLLLLTIKLEGLLLQANNQNHQIQNGKAKGRRKGRRQAHSSDEEHDDKDHAGTHMKKMDAHKVRSTRPHGDADKQANRASPAADEDHEDDNCDIGHSQHRNVMDVHTQQCTFNCRDVDQEAHRAFPATQEDQLDCGSTRTDRGAQSVHTHRSTKHYRDAEKGEQRESLADG
jgi:hypothetical protein